MGAEGGEGGDGEMWRDVPYALRAIGTLDHCEVESRLWEDGDRLNQVSIYHIAFF